MSDPTLGEQIAELERELSMRTAVYPRMIERGTLRPARADRQLTVLRAAIESLRGLQVGEGSGR